MILLGRRVFEGKKKLEPGELLYQRQPLSPRVEEVQLLSLTVPKLHTSRHHPSQSSQSVSARSTLLASEAPSAPRKCFFFLFRSSPEAFVPREAIHSWKAAYLTGWVKWKPMKKKENGEIPEMEGTSAAQLFKDHIHLLCSGNTGSRSPFIKPRLKH